MRDVSVDIDFLTRTYFYFDKPVQYKVNGGFINITPVPLISSEIFLSSADIINIDKNSLPDPSIIQMTYLQYVCQVLLGNKVNLQKFVNILFLCMDLKKPAIKWLTPKKPSIYDPELGIEITPKQFDEIRKIIMYQNILHFDDSYVNPELKKAMAEVDTLKNKDLVPPNLERRIAIITAHSGLPKREQELMTYRSHTLLFEEVCGEVEYTTTRPIALYTGQGDKMQQWINKKNKDKFEGYIKSVDSYTNSMGGSQAIRATDTSVGDSYMQQFNNFNK